MPTIHLVIGPVGAGKSTLCLSLRQEHRAVVMNLDQWMAALFNADRPDGDTLPWYLARIARCVDHIWELTERVLDAGSDVVLEIGLIQKNQRQDFLAKVDAAARDLKIYVVDAPRDMRWQRVQRRNQMGIEVGDDVRDPDSTFSMVVPEKIFHMASDLWEPLDDIELSDRDVRFV